MYAVFDGFLDGNYYTMINDVPLPRSWNDFILSIRKFFLRSRTIYDEKVFLVVVFHFFTLENEVMFDFEICYDSRYREKT